MSTIIRPEWDSAGADTAYDGSYVGGAQDTGRPAPKQIEEVWGMRDPEPWELAWNEVATQVEQDNDAWRARWPAHCQKCGGWGLFQFEERHGFTHGASETITDPCEAHEDIRVCHRCGCLGLNDQGEGPCTACGWNYDDGLRTM